MTVTVTERDDDHKSRETRALGRQAWDVHQQGMLVGVFFSEQEADAYRCRLELEELQRRMQRAERF
ncbi:MAG: hypothetical protein GAK45_02315 [Pseudomonas citronellolis]|nr:MAG: hypothetical protein GAK45_02315 [Pseudomonas citronellolis]